MKLNLDKVDQKQLRMLLAVLMILILFCSYQFGYMKFNKKTETMKEENVVLQQRFDELSNQVAQEAYYKESMKLYQDEMKAILNQYGPGTSPEKSTKFLVELSEATGMSIPTISFTPDEQIFASTTVPSASGLGVYAYKNRLSINYSSTYQGLKDCLAIIHQNPERMNVESISASFDAETGNLSGSLVINQYSMLGTGTMYEPPILGDISIGINNIFGIYESQNTVEGN